MSAHGNTIKALLVLLICLALLSCRSMTMGKWKGAAAKKQPVVALVLGGGSAKGFAHVGEIGRASCRERVLRAV
jgi:hypothetical protein